MNTQAQPAAAKPARVLVVDDEPQIVRALKVVLREAGFQAVTAETASQALDLAAVFVADIVLHAERRCLDNQPEGTGFELLRIEAHLAAEISYIDVRVVAHRSQHPGRGRAHRESARSAVNNIAAGCSFGLFFRRSRTLGHASISACATQTAFTTLEILTRSNDEPLHRS